MSIKKKEEIMCGQPAEAVSACPHTHTLYHLDAYTHIYICLKSNRR